MFEEDSAFNQDISAWAVDSVTDMSYIFWGASAFDQDLGWCVDHGVFDGWGHDIQDAFSNTPCASTSCGVLQGICDYPMTDSNIRTAVAAWLGFTLDI